MVVRFLLGEIVHAVVKTHAEKRGELDAVLKHKRVSFGFKSANKVKQKRLVH